MARPKADTEAITTRIIDEAILVIKENRGRRLILSDIAARLGMSQSYIYRFFPTKSDLARELAKRWFAKVEAASRQAAEQDCSPGQRLEKWVLAILDVKRQAYDEDPELFLAFLELAKDHRDTVQGHLDLLQTDLKSVLAKLVPAKKLEEMLALTLDATLLFRTPQNIAQYRSSATDERARAIVQMLLSQC